MTLVMAAWEGGEREVRMRVRAAAMSEARWASHQHSTVEVMVVATCACCAGRVVVSEGAWCCRPWCGGGGDGEGLGVRFEVEVR